MALGSKTKATGYFAKHPLCVALVSALVAALVLVLVSFVGTRSSHAADGSTYEPKIVGGTSVPDSKYPFMVALLDTRKGATAFDQLHCGGTLIDRDSVLTAAHCVEGLSATPLRVTVGRTVLNSDQGQTRRVSKILIHPRWFSLTVAYDAAVLKLSRPVRGADPLRLATSSQDFLEKAGRDATVAGWGYTAQRSPDGYTPDKKDTWVNRMREAQVPIVSDSGAEQAYDAIYGPSGYIPPIQVAAGTTGKDACEGDSGGPMFTKLNGRFTQIGITSFGYGCGESGYPGVYAEVNNPSIRGFISNAAIE
jgi:secreted trypsin-like serine protease